MTDPSLSVAQACAIVHNRPGPSPARQQRCDGGPQPSYYLGTVQYNTYVHTAAAHLPLLTVLPVVIGTRQTERMQKGAAG